MLVGGDVASACCALLLEMWGRTDSSSLNTLWSVRLCWEAGFQGHLFQTTRQLPCPTSFMPLVPHMDCKRAWPSFAAQLARTLMYAFAEQLPTLIRHALTLHMHFACTQHVLQVTPPSFSCLL